MMQFNLLPDVKLEYIRAKRLKVMMTAISIIVSAASVVIAVILFVSVGVVQKNHMNNLNEDISVAARKVQATPDLNRILTVQNQLQSLSGVHSTKPATTRMFDYLAQVTPLDVSLSSAKFDMVGNIVTLTGQAPSLLAINTYVDTLKFTGYQEFIEGAETGDNVEVQFTPAFTQVLLTGFATEKDLSTFQISFVYDPMIFDNQKSIKLTVPERITTRSQQQLLQSQTDALFKENPNAESEEQ